MSTPGRRVLVSPGSALQLDGHIHIRYHKPGRRDPNGSATFSADDMHAQKHRRRKQPVWMGTSAALEHGCTRRPCGRGRAQHTPDPSRTPHPPYVLDRGAEAATRTPSHHHRSGTALPAAPAPASQRRARTQVVRKCRGPLPESPDSQLPAGKVLRTPTISAQALPPVSERTQAVCAMYVLRKMSRRPPGVLCSRGAYDIPCHHLTSRHLTSPHVTSQVITRVPLPFVLFVRRAHVDFLFNFILFYFSLPFFFSCEK